MWFSGPISSAIAKAKDEQNILLVFVRSQASDADSDELEGYFTSDEAKNIITENNIVALNLAGGSEAAEQFKAIYPIPRLPMSYLISPSGKPLGIQTGPAEDLDALLRKLRDAVRLHGERQAAANASAGVPLDVRVEAARARLEEKRAEAAAEADEEKKAAEIRRREEGRSMRDAQAARRDAETLKDAQERRRQKALDKAHLARIREQIAHDRQEKAAKFGKAEVAQSEERQKRTVELDEAAKKKLADDNEKRLNSARIQFKFSDQSTKVQTYESDQPFSEAVAFVTGELCERDWFLEGPVRYFQMYPRKELTEADHAKTFRDLGLNPTAVILVLPTATRGTQAVEGGGVMGRLWGFPSAVLGIVLALLNSVLGFVGLGGERQVTGPAAPGEREKRIGRLGPEGSGEVRRRKGADDDNATYNGNSTQQL